MKAKIHTLLVWLAVFFMTLPIIWMFGTAFKSPSEIMQSGAKLLPSQLSLSSFEKLFEGDLLRLVGNTVLVSVGATAVSVVLAFPLCLRFSALSLPR